MEEFEQLLMRERVNVERYVRFRICSREDAEDLLQEIYLTAYLKFPQLKDPACFKAWLLRIAQNKCRDYFRRRADQWELPLDAISQLTLSESRYGLSVQSTVQETLGKLGGKDKQILYLFYWQELPQEEIARRLEIPLGTVKSRLHTAKRHFKAKYPFNMGKDEKNMKKLPEFLPEYTIHASDRPPFSVKWEELMGWFLIPKPGETLSWGMYDLPSRRCDHVYDMAVTGRARVHGIEGVELTARESPCSGKADPINRTFVAQLTDTHCRFLATIRNDNGLRNYITFLDGEEFMPNWGFGENNIGNETNLTPKGDIQRTGSVITCAQKDFLLDIAGRYEVAIGGKVYDTVCVMDIETYNCGVVSEQFLDSNGRTVLWRRFNRNDWAIDRYKQPWTELLPDNERLTVNGTTYVHWYDCITDYILR